MGQRAMETEGSTPKGLQSTATGAHQAQWYVHLTIIFGL
jgi:hypothetical protein